MNPNTPPGRWQPHALRRVVAIEAPIWHAAPGGSLALMAGAHVLATVRSNRKEGAAQRYLLQVPGWEWRSCAEPAEHSHAKRFMTRAGAQIEAEDIVAGAKDWHG